MERPYRIYNATTKEFLRWRCYAYPKNAHMGALIEARWAKVTTTLEVVNHDTGRLLGQYTHEVGTGVIRFRGEKNEYAKPKRGNVHHIKRRKETIDKATGEIRQSA